MSLYDLKIGDEAIITHVVDHRIREVGLMEGVQISVFKSGNPCILDVKGMRIVIGNTEILVKRT